MSLLFRIKHMINSIFLNRETSVKIHDIKNKYGAKTIQEEIRFRRLDAQIKKTVIYKLGQSQVLRDIDAILGGR